MPAEPIPLESNPTISMPLQSFQETRNELVSRLTTVYHGLQDRHLPLTTVGGYLLELTSEIDTLKHMAETQALQTEQQLQWN